MYLSEPFPHFVYDYLATGRKVEAPIKTAVTSPDPGASGGVAAH